ncbi:MAG: hypothetical protein JO281_09745 [Pseudonocardiales bacterium]|nr:hypothetical protein [Pseudonocardiales bacterium]MBV9161814.1 hypothetical protein [Pseudonocardiales bacterium]
MSEMSSKPVPTTPGGPDQQWFFDNFASVTDALNYLNESPAQGPGEASAIARNDGTVGLFFLAPGSENSGQQWSFRNFASVADALGFLNNNVPVEGAGEVSANARNDGSVGVFYLSPA